MKQDFKFSPPIPVVGSDIGPDDLRPNYAINLTPDWDSQWSKYVREAAFTISTAYNETLEKYIRLALMFYPAKNIIFEHHEDRHESPHLETVTGIYGSKYIKVHAQNELPRQALDWAYVYIEKKDTLYTVHGRLSDYATSKVKEL